MRLRGIFSGIGGIEYGVVCAGARLVVPVLGAVCLGLGGMRPCMSPVPGRVDERLTNCCFSDSPRCDVVMDTGSCRALELSPDEQLLLFQKYHIYFNLIDAEPPEPPPPS